MTGIEKPAYNEEIRTMQFRRPDGKGQLAEGEIVASAEVICTECEKGTDTTAQMVSGVAPYDQTQVKYVLKGGVVGRLYYLAIHITTSLGQKLSETIVVRVTA